MAEFPELERILGVEFADKSLLQRALTHRSYLNEHPDFAFEDNERLEFLGDAVLDFLTGEYLYHRFPELAEGPLTSLRSSLVRREALAQFAQQIGLGQYLLLGHGETASGGRSRPATLCATFEAVVGALYLDQGIEAVRRFFEPLIGPEVAHTLREQLDKDDKSRLQELAQGRLRCTPHYSTVREAGPDHAKMFTVQVTICGTVYGQGTGPSKQQAAQSAAQQALQRLEAEEFEAWVVEEAESSVDEEL
jgi:ribonuclease III